MFTLKKLAAAVLMATFVAGATAPSRGDGPMVPAPKLPPPTCCSLKPPSWHGQKARAQAPKFPPPARSTFLSDGTIVYPDGCVLYKSGSYVYPNGVTGHL